MRVLLARLDVRVTEADRVGDRANVLLRPGQEVPPVTRLGAAVLPEVAVLGLVRDLGGFLGVEADRDDAELFADRVVELLQRVGEAVQHHAAQHRAARIVQRDDDRNFLVEVLREQHVLSGFVLERQVLRQAAAEPLVHVHALELLGQRLGAVHDLARRHRRRRRNRGDEESGREHRPGEACSESLHYGWLGSAGEGARQARGRPSAADCTTRLGLLLLFGLGSFRLGRLGGGGTFGSGGCCIGSFCSGIGSFCSGVSTVSGFRTGVSGSRAGVDARRGRGRRLARIF